MDADLHCDSQVLAVAFAPNGSALATRDRNNVTVWNLADDSARLRISFPGDFEQTLAYRRDGVFLAASRDGLIDPTTTFWNTTTGHVVRTATGGYLLALSPDGESAALLGRQGELGQYDVLAVFDLLTGQRAFEIGSTHTRGTKALGFTEDGRLTSASVEANGIVLRRWDYYEGRLADSMIVSDNLDFMNVDAVLGPVSSTLAYRAWGRSGTTPAVRVIELTSNTEVLRLSDVPIGPFPAAFSDGGSRIALAQSETAVLVSRLPSGGSVGTVPGLPSRITALALSPDGLSVAVGSLDAVVRIRSLPRD